MESRLVPDVFDRLDTNKWIDVEFEKGVKMERGNLLKSSMLSKLPHISWEAEDFKFYTVAIFDPDASNVLDPNRECLQYLAYNVKGNNLNSGKIFADYLPPNLTKEKPKHRLVFAVYEQQGEIFPIEKPLSNQGLERCDFHLQDWRKKYNLGHPIAYNYFESEFDENAPILGTGLLTTLVEGVQSSVHYLGEKVQAGYETVKEGVHELREKMHEKKEELRQKAQETKEDIKEGAQEVQRDFQEKKEEVKKDFQEKKAEVREQQPQRIDVRQSETTQIIPTQEVGSFPSVEKKINKFENLSTGENLPPQSYETLSTGQKTIPTQPVISSTTTTTTTIPTETQPSLLVTVAEGMHTVGHVVKENLQAGAHVVKENLQAGYELLKEKMQVGAEVVKENLQAGAEVVKENLQAGAQVVKENVQAGAQVVKEKVASGIENLKEGAQVAKENVQAGYEVAKEKTFEKAEQLQQGVQNIKEDVKEGMQNAQQNINQKINENLTPTTTTTFASSYPTPTQSSGVSQEQFPSMQEQINRFEKLAINEDVSFLNEGEPAKEVKGESMPFGGENVDIAIAQGTSSSSIGKEDESSYTFSNINQPTQTGFGTDNPFSSTTPYTQQTTTFSTTTSYPSSNTSFPSSSTSFPSSTTEKKNEFDSKY